MARNNRSNRGGSRNNNPEGHNQYSGGVIDMARERPVAAAAAAAAAVGAGVFLWSRRNQISDQISNLSDQFGDWTQNMNFGGQASADDTAGLTSTGQSGSSSRAQSDNSGMGSGSSRSGSLGRQTGEAGTRSSATGRGRTRSQPTG